MAVELPTNHALMSAMCHSSVTGSPENLPRKGQALKRAEAGGWPIQSLIEAYQVEPLLAKQYPCGFCFQELDPGLIVYTNWSSGIFRSLSIHKTIFEALVFIKG